MVKNTTHVCTPKDLALELSKLKFWLIHVHHVQDHVCANPYGAIPDRCPVLPHRDHEWVEPAYPVYSRIYLEINWLFVNFVSNSIKVSWKIWSIPQLLPARNRNHKCQNQRFRGAFCLHCDIFVGVRARLLRFSSATLCMTGILHVQRQQCHWLGSVWSGSVRYYPMSGIAPLSPTFKIKVLIIWFPNKSFYRLSQKIWSESLWLLFDWKYQRRHFSSELVPPITILKNWFVMQFLPELPKAPTLKVTLRVITCFEGRISSFGCKGRCVYLFLVNSVTRILCRNIWLCGKFWITGHENLQICQLRHGQLRRKMHWPLCTKLSIWTKCAASPRIIF